MDIELLNIMTELMRFGNVPDLYNDNIDIFHIRTKNYNKNINRNSRLLIYTVNIRNPTICAILYYIDDSTGLYNFNSLFVRKMFVLKDHFVFYANNFYFYISKNKLYLSDLRESYIKNIELDVFGGKYMRKFISEIDIINSLKLQYFIEFYFNAPQNSKIIENNENNNLDDFILIDDANSADSNSGDANSGNIINIDKLMIEKELKNNSEDKYYDRQKFFSG